MSTKVCCNTCQSILTVACAMTICTNTAFVYVMVPICILNTADDIWPQWQRNEAEGEPEWLQNERDNVFKYRDLDGDQKLSRVSRLLCHL